MKLILPDNDDINGIIHYMQTIYGSKVQSLVKMENSTVQVDYMRWRDAEALIRYDLYKSEGPSNWCSENKPNSYFILSFSRHLIEMTNYTFITRNANEADDFPANWKVEGSNNKNDWQYIDHKTSQSALRQLSVMKTFKVQKPGKYKYFKFEHNGTGSGGRNFFCLGKIDVFGKLYGILPDKECSCMYKGRECKLILSLFHIIVTYK